MIATLTIHLHLPTCTSLKEKRGRIRPLIARLHREFNTALRAPAVKTFMDGAAIEAVGSTPAEFATFFHEEKARWAKIIKETGARID
jgi:tripartite-type tricarboxylate transporter receptor subunit TctC